MQIRRLKRMIREAKKLQRANFFPYFANIEQNGESYTLSFLNEPDLPVFSDVDLQACINKAYQYMSGNKRIRERLEYLREIGSRVRVSIPVPRGVAVTVPDLFEGKNDGRIKAERKN